MNIAMICTEKLPVPPIAGGAVQLYIEGVLPYISKQHRITVYSIQYPGLPDKEIRDNVRYIRIPGKTVTMYVNSLKARVDKAYDLVHVFNRPRTILSLMDTLPDTRLSLSLHNEMFHPEKISLEDGARCIERVEFINTVSKFIAGRVKTRFPSAEVKTNVVYSGANMTDYKPNWSVEGALNKLQLKKKFGIEDKRVVLFVGRLSQKKGVHVILNAMKKVMESNPKTALVIVGSKWYGKNDSDDYTRSIMTLSKSLPGPIIFTGFIPPHSIPALYNLGDIFVCASQWNEPLARVHFEAMAAGLPIITTDRGGNAEVVDGYGNGMVIEEYKDCNIMAENINFLLKNPVKALEMGKRGRLLVEKKFNWERVANEIFKPAIISAKR